MGWFSNLFGGNNSTANSNSSNTGSNDNNYNSYLEASGVGNQIANDQINTLIANKDNLQNQPGVVTVNPKFNDFIANNTNPDGSYNSAAQAIINQYDTGTNAYQQAMNNIIQSSPQGAAAYANQFPISNALMNAGSAIVGGGLFPGSGLIMNALQNAGSGVSGIVNQGMDFIQDNFMTSGSITEKPEEVDQFKNYLNNLQGLNDAAGSGISPLLDTPASATNPINRDGQIQRDADQITVDPVTEQGLDAFFGGQSQTDSFEDFDRRIPPKKTTQDYIDEFNDMFNLDEKKEIFGIEGKEIITPQGVDVSQESINDSGYYHPRHKSWVDPAEAATMWSDKKYETLGGHPDFQTNLSNAPDIYKGIYERMINEHGMTDEEAKKNLNRIAGDGGPGTPTFPSFSFKDGGITRL